MSAPSTPTHAAAISARSEIGMDETAFAKLMDDPETVKACLKRTSTAVRHVVSEIHQHILDSEDLVHQEQFNLAKQYSNDALSSRYLEGMPSRLKVAVGRPGGIDFDELVSLSHDQDCASNSKWVGAYLIFGWGLQQKATREQGTKFAILNPPSPVYGGEAYFGRRSMKGRTSQHTLRSCRNNRFRSNQQKRLYSILDDQEAPQQAYAICMYKDKAIDKVFGKFAEMVTRTLLGTSANVPRCWTCSRFKTHGILVFKTPITPTNCTDVLREGIVDLALANAKLEASQASGLICNRCDTSDASHWNLDPEEEGKLVCERCLHCYKKHGFWPDKERIEAREAEKAQRADRKQRAAPGYCENVHCGVQKNAKPSWYWISDLQIWMCSNCARRHRELGELRRPHRGPGYCENENCRATTNTRNWHWNDSLGFWLCSRCRDYARHHADNLWKPPSQHCENPRCDNSISSSSRHRHKELGIWLCVACDTWARRHDNELRKPLPKNRLGLHNGLCSNPQCAVKESPKWLWSNLLQLKVCFACYQWALNHNGELRPSRKTKFFGPCQNLHCADTGPTKWCWSEELQLHLCNACHTWARRHDGGLRKPKKMFTGPCQNPKCARIDSTTWSWSEVLKLLVCGTCYRWALRHNGDLRVHRPAKRKRHE